MKSIKNITPIKIHSPYEPAGDQPTAIKNLVENLENGVRDQVLLGVTGSGKTFTMAQVIQKTQRPALIMAPNKILAAQLYGEMKEFFPENAVCYFVSYYDYYQPEAYIPGKDVYIEKTASINEQIDRMRHEATRALLERRDAIIIASVSCIYGLGDVNSYSEMIIDLEVGQSIEMGRLKKQLTELQYHRNDISLSRGTYRSKGDTLEIFPSHYDDRSWRIVFFGDEIERITENDPLTGEKMSDLEKVRIYPNSHYVTPGPTIQQAIKGIRKDLAIRLQELKDENKLLEYERLKNKTEYDLEVLKATNTCNGIENYSRYLTGRDPGAPPPTLFEYLPDDALLIVDESHVAVPQVYGMYRGDQVRKKTLSDHGFRLPSCADNRPLKFEEWDHTRPQTIFVSATPGPFELKSPYVVEQVVRPTGLIDPVCIVKPCTHQVDDLILACSQTIKKGLRVLVTVLTKKMAEALSRYLMESNYKVTYMHSDIDTLERIKIIQNLRKGEIDILIGINLLREGLDIPECGLVAILDADKEGFLRSQTSLIQTIGRAARNSEGMVILFADNMTKSLKAALDETERRRNKQIQYNELHNIKPQTIIKSIRNALELEMEPKNKKKKFDIVETNISKLHKMMLQEAENLNFEKASYIRDRIKELEEKQLRDAL